MKIGYSEQGLVAKVKDTVQVRREPRLIIVKDIHFVQ